MPRAIRKMEMSTSVAYLVHAHQGRGQAGIAPAQPQAAVHSEIFLCVVHRQPEIVSTIKPIVLSVSVFTLNPAKFIREKESLNEQMKCFIARWQ